MTKFQLALTIGFGVLILGGVILFSAYRGSSKNAVTLTVWGTISENNFKQILEATPLKDSEEIKVQYVAKSAEDFDQDFIEALASGRGPDIFMLPSDKILTHRNKIFPIPYNVFTQRQFRDAFIEGAEIYMAPEGSMALPVTLDPLVMYWNRSIFTDARLTEPPKYWDEFYNLANLISKKDGALNISKSAVAFGEYVNIKNAKEIVLNLAMQAGTPIIAWNGSTPRSVFADPLGKPTIPAEAAVNFYTEFSNPAKTSYSWNRSLADSSNYFLSGDLALYFGFASEAPLLQVRNPNLNFDVALSPTSREGGVNVSYAKFNAFAITKASTKKNAAFTAISILSGPQAAATLSQVTKLPPVRRDLLGKRPTGTYEAIYYESAIRSKSWLDPNPEQSDATFKYMIESITSGKARTGESVGRASRELSNLLVN